MFDNAQVLQIRSSAGLYGAEHMLLGLSAALPQAGVSSTLLCLNNYLQSEQQLFERAQALNIPAQLIACRGRLDLSTVSAIVAQIRKQRPALLHAHDYKSAFYAWLAARRTRLPLVATVHGWVETSRALRLYKQLEILLLRRFDRVCVVSAVQSDALRASGIAAERISLIANGIDGERFSPSREPLSRVELGIDPATFVFGTVGRLASEKNPQGLIDAFAAVARRNPAVALLFAGDGPLRAHLEQYAVTLGVRDKIHFLGARHDVERIYPLLDCFVLPSHSEGMPLALLEAMACARPVVASAVGQIPQILRAAAHAQLVTPGDPQALIDAMRRASAERTADPAAREYVLLHHSLITMAREYASLYETIRRQGDGCAAA
jgi:L-malate glycosyltransferase